LNLETWLVDYYQLRHRADDSDVPIKPATRLEDWDRLKDKVIHRRYALADGSGRSMPVVFTCIDSGGEEGVTAKAYAFWRSLDNRERLRCRLVKGSSSKEAVKESIVANDVPLLLLGSNLLKDIVFSSIHREEIGPDYFHVPSWATEAYLKGLANSEIRESTGWKAVKGARNEPLDLMCYARAAAIYLGADKEDFWKVPPSFAVEWERNPLLSTKPLKPVMRGPRVINSGVSIY
jgi:phage terminase large subunit GpA-like protein